MSRPSLPERGVWPLLAFLTSAATGPGRAELEAAIGVDAATAPQAARTVLDVLRESPAARMPLGLWTRADLPLNPAWLDEVPLDAQGKLTGDLEADKSGLDAWAAEQTDGLIKSMPVQLDTETLLVLASALTVRTAWERPFEDSWFPLSGSGAWSGRDFVRLSRMTSTLEDLRVMTTPEGPVTILRVGRTDLF
ncbi:MAG: hypothetical protein JWN52_4646 [Actinomycetia bacterium]|nr:hypothetical protein [Actinomycetes bacterium]